MKPLCCFTHLRLFDKQYDNPELYKYIRRIWAEPHSKPFVRDVKL